MRYIRVFPAKASKGLNRPDRTIRRCLGAAATALVVMALALPAGAAPAAPVITAPQDGAFLNSPTPTIQGNASGDAVLVRIFAGAAAVMDTGVVSGFWTADVPLADGPHTIRARARDAGGVFGPLSDPITITVDTVPPPKPVITAPTDGQLVGFSSVTVEGASEPGSRVEVEASTGALLHATTDPGGTWRVTHPFADAEHTLVATAFDAAGNHSLPSDPVTFRVDTIPPVAPTIYTPGHGTFQNQATLTITGAAEPGATVRVFRGSTILMEVAATDGTWSGPHTFTEGTHSITARAFDPAGHASPPSPTTTFTVDLTPPPAPVIATPRDGDVVPHQYEVRGTAEPFATVELLKTNKVVARAFADASGAWSVLQSAFSGGQLLKARAVDRAGNVGPLSPTIEFLVDASPPPPPEVHTKSGTIFLPTQLPRIEGTARDDIGVLAISLEYYDLLGREHATIDANCQGCTGPQVNWQTTFAPLPGRYEIKVYTIDRAGNRSLPTQISILRL